MAFAYDFAVSVAVTADSMPVTVAEFAFVGFVICIFQYAKVELIVFELALKLIPVLELVMADQLVIVFPLTIEKVTVFIRIIALPVSFSVSDSAKKVLIGGEIDFGLTFESVFFEFTFVLGVIATPNVHAFAVFLGHGVFAVEEIAIGVENFALAFDMGLMPIGFNFRAIRKSYRPKAMFPAIHKISFIQSTIIIKILAPAILLPLDPQPLILIHIGIPHSPLPFLYIIPPLAFIHIAIRIPVPTPSLFAILDTALIGFAVFEDVCAVDELILKPGAEVDVA
jgi:hypothetical protein